MFAIDATPSPAAYKAFLGHLADYAYATPAARDDDFMFTIGDLASRLHYTSDDLRRLLKQAQADNVVASVVRTIDNRPSPKAGDIVGPLKAELLSLLKQPEAVHLARFTSLVDMANAIIAERAKEFMADSLAKDIRVSKATLVASLPQSNDELERRINDVVTLAEKKERDFIDVWNSRASYDYQGEVIDGYRFVNWRGMANQSERLHQLRAARTNRVNSIVGWTIAAGISLGLLALVIFMLIPWIEASNAKELEARRVSCQELERSNTVKDPALIKAYNLQFAKKSCAEFGGVPLKEAE